MRHPPKPVQDVDPLKLDTESNVESPVVLPGPDLLAVSEVKIEVEVHEDDIASPDPDPVSEVMIKEGPTIIKVEPPLIEWVYQEVRRTHSEERMSPGEYPPPAHAHDPDVKLSAKYYDPFVKHVHFADSPANTKGSQNNNIPRRQEDNPAWVNSPSRRRCHQPGHQMRTYVGQPFHLRLGAQPSEGPQKGRPEWPQDKKLVGDTREHDDNDNIVGHPDTKLNKTGAQVWRSILPQGYGYEEKPEVKRDDDDDSWYDDSSEAPSDQTDDDDGHEDCGKGGFHSCLDHPDNIYLQEGEDGSVTARYVEWNLVSETGSLEYSNSTGEGGSPRVEEDVEPDPEEAWEQFRGGANAENNGYAFETQEMADTRCRK